MNDELWQLYDPDGQPIAGKGAAKDEVFGKGLLHGASHIWIWRKNNDTVEVLLQKRSATKRTWPNTYDISAGGHIDLGEEPLAAALRETKEEIGIDVRSDALNFIEICRANMIAPGGSIENEFQWLYLLELNMDDTFTLETEEVASIEWKPIADFQTEVMDSKSPYVPHGNTYYQTIIDAITRLSS